MDKQSQEYISNHMLSAFLEKFPRGWINFRPGVIGKNTSFFITFGVQQSHLVPNGIYQNDVGYHHLVIRDNGTEFEIDCIVGGHVWTKPNDPAMAMGKVKCGWRKKKSTEESHIVKHFDAYLVKLVATLRSEIENDNLMVGQDTLALY